MGVTRSLVKLTIGGAIVLGGLAFPALLTKEGIVWGTVLATSLASVAAGNTANAIDALTQGKEGDRISLENEDLTKAVGKAIAAVITLAAKQHPRDTRNKLEKIAAQAKDNWVKIAQQELTQQRYPELREAKLDEFLTPEEYSLTQNGNLTPQEWQDIFIRLNMAASKGGGFQLPPEVYPQVADLLHTTFPKALRETLKEDFVKDGKAFAGLTLQLLTGMKAELAQLRNTNLAVNTAELTQILQQFQQLETQLGGTVAQQQAFFRQISQQIDSGFAEVCQRLGVMETTITGLLQNLEESLERLRQDVAEVRQEMRQGFEEIRTQQGGRQLSRQELKARQKLLSEVETEVESRLAQSLHHAIPLNLGKEQQPHQVQRPWDVSVKVGEERSFKLPSETSILEVFENPAINGKFLILGKPGGGKTTTLLQLAEALIQRAETDSDAPIPVILELSEWRTVTKAKFPDFWNKEKYDPSIKEWILSQLRSKGISQEIGEQWIREKELVLLLDGLDELPSERQAKCVQAINQFLHSEFSPLHLVVCSRKEEYEEYEEVLHLNGAICLEDLTVEQMRHYFASVNLGKFWESIKDSEKIINFIRQPLFLAIPSIAYQQIEVEEWKNCNTERNSIDYLLEIYRIKAFQDSRKTKYYAQKQILCPIFQNRLIRIALFLEKNQISAFRVDRIQPNFLFTKSAIVFRAVTLIVSLLFCSALGLASGLFLINYHLLLFPLIINWMSFFLFIIIVVIIFVVTIAIVISCINRISTLKETSNQGYKILKLFLIIILLLPLATACICALVLLSIIFNLYSIWTETNIPLLKGAMSGFVIAILCNLGDINSKSRISPKTEKIGEIFILLMQIAIFAILFSQNIDIFLFFFSASTGAYIVWRIPIDEDISSKNNMILNVFLYSMLFGGIGIFSGIIPVFKFGIGPALSNSMILSLIFSLFAGFAGIQHLALRLTLWGTGQMPWNITRFLDYCTERLILQRVGNRYRFIHRLVQEHFANLEIQKE
ncbi:NACHT domain-containing protein [Argonema antarcticum]|uniref:NACHT domain-containing protein n=1 Tax=Argonema antarcticum TaxID=2942763 RepID=UPI00201302C1|nr:NACHT domain-containing protein [Argonema antarcticum]MCL1474157.1 NACHT domain-containing protein [Argonema antarcticum A004/B2]